jgi:hypothetical protein
LKEAARMRKLPVLILILFLMSCVTASQPGSLEYTKERQKQEVRLKCINAFKEYEWRTWKKVIHPNPWDVCDRYANSVVK